MDMKRNMLMCHSIVKKTHRNKQNLSDNFLNYIHTYIHTCAHTHTHIYGPLEIIDSG